MNANKDLNPDFEDDDVFYAELRKQILLLTADEDEDFVDRRHTNSDIASRRGLNNFTNFATALQPGSYFNWWECKNSNSVPSWLVNLWRNGNGNGTGVFIPRIVKPRKYKSGRRKNERRIFRPVGQLA